MAWEKIIKKTSTSDWYRRSAARTMGIGLDGTVYNISFREIDGYDQIFLYTSTDNGDTWIEEQITFTSTNKATGCLGIGFSDTLHVIWYEDIDATRPTEIYYIERAGGVWSSPVLVNSRYHVIYPKMVMSTADACHIAYAGRDGATSLRVYYQNNSSGSWSDVETVSVSTALTHLYTCIAWDPWDGEIGSIPHVYYTQLVSSFGPVRILQRERDLAGNWSDEEIVLSDGYRNSIPCVVIDTDHTQHLLFLRDPYSGNETAYYMQKPRGGSWSTPESLISSSNIGDLSLSIDSNGTRHVVLTYVSNYVRHLWKAVGAGSWSSEQVYATTWVNYANTLWQGHPYWQPDTGCCFTVVTHTSGQGYQFWKKDYTPYIPVSGSYGYFM